VSGQFHDPAALPREEVPPPYPLDMRLQSQYERSGEKIFVHLSGIKLDRPARTLVTTLTEISLLIIIIVVIIIYICIFSDCLVCNYCIQMNG
jgi:hypothetical protein